MVTGPNVLEHKRNRGEVPVDHPGSSCCDFVDSTLSYNIRLFGYPSILNYTRSVPINKGLISTRGPPSTPKPN